MNLPDEKREALAEAIADAQCASCGHEAGDHSWLGPCLHLVFDPDEVCPCRKSRERVFADALAPLIAGWLAEEGARALREAADAYDPETEMQARGWVVGWLRDRADVLAAGVGDEEGLQALLGFGICPRCHKRGFIGHGPLCWECYTGEREPLPGTETAPGAPNGPARDSQGREEVKKP